MPVNHDAQVISSEEIRSSKSGEGFTMSISHWGMFFGVMEAVTEDQGRTFFARWVPRHPDEMVSWV